MTKKDDKHADEVDKKTKSSNYKKTKKNKHAGEVGD